MPARPVTRVTGYDGSEMGAAPITPSPDTAPHRLMPDMRGFSATLGPIGVGLYICARALFLTLAQALFVEEGVRSIRQSVQNGQFQCSVGDQ